MVRLAELIPDFVVVETQLVLPPNTSKQICVQDPTRWGVIVGTAVSATTPVFVSTSNQQQATQGMQVSINTLPLSLNFRDYGPVVTGPLFALVAGMGVMITVIEVFYRPQTAESNLGQMAEYLDEIGSPQ